jgi:hypothetical protein
VYPYPSPQAEEKSTPDGGSKGAVQQSLKIKPSAFPALDDVREGGGFYDDVLDSARGMDDGIQFPTLLTGTEIATEARAAAALAAAAFEDSSVSSARSYETKLPDLLCTKSDKVLLLFPCPLKLVANNLTRRRSIFPHLVVTEVGTNLTIRREKWIDEYIIIF